MQISAAIDEMNIDWNAQASRAARAVLHGGSGTTKWLLGRALISAGRFTRPQAEYAVRHLAVDWNAEAVKGFQHLLDTGRGWSRSALTRHVMVVDHFTAGLARYAADHAKVDWNRQAVKAARSYAPGSRRGVERTLTERGFNLAQADYAADALGYYTVAQSNAIDAAQQYLGLQGFSRQGLIDQLSSSYGAGFSVADATFGVDHIKVDWNAEAVRAAKSYLKLQPFSRQGLIDQLSSDFGGEFTVAQAIYAANRVGL
jgi:hypothetical protein